jgi:hypothetical protein
VRMRGQSEDPSPDISQGWISRIWLNPYEWHQHIGGHSSPKASERQQHRVSTTHTVHGATGVVPVLQVLVLFFGEPSSPRIHSGHAPPPPPPSLPALRPHGPISSRPMVILGPRLRPSLAQFCRLPSIPRLCHSVGPPRLPGEYGVRCTSLGCSSPGPLAPSTTF